MGWKRYAKKALSIGADVASVAVHLKQKTNPIGLTFVGLSLANSALKAFPEKEPLEGWVPLLNLSSYRDALFKALKPELKLLGQSHSNCQYFEWKAHPVRWSKGGPIPSVPHLPPETSDEEREEVTRMFRNVLWSQVEDHGLFERYEENWQTHSRLAPDNVGQAMPSQLGEALWERLRPLHEQNQKVAVLLYGPPGTGKSCLSRFLAEKMGGQFLRIRAKDLMYASYVSPAIKFLKPPMVLVDDLDRCDSSIINLFDEIKASCPIVVSVNSYEEMDKALLRPGRFDEIVEVKYLGKDVLDPLLKGVPEEDAAELRLLPIAYIKRYLDLQQLLSQEEASLELPKLVERYEYITNS